MAPDMNEAVKSLTEKVHFLVKQNEQIMKQLIINNGALREVQSKVEEFSKTVRVEEKPKDEINYSPEELLKEEKEEELQEALDKLEEENISFTCKHCDFGSNDNTALDDHIKVTHKEISQTKCSKCSRTFSKHHELENHVKYVHDSTRVQCATCKLKVTNSATLEKHIAERHGIEDKPRYRNSSFQTAYQKKPKQHMGEEQRSINNLKCNECRFTCVKQN